MSERPTITLCNPMAASSFRVGQTVGYRERRRWYVRLWHWLRRKKYPAITVITDIDYETGTITLSSS